MDAASEHNDPNCQIVKGTNRGAILLKREGTYPVFASDFLYQRRDNHARRGPDRVHNTVEETSVIRRQILIVGQVGDASCSVEAQRQHQEHVCEDQMASRVANQNEENAWNEVG